MHSHPGKSGCELKGHNMQFACKANPRTALAAVGFLLVSAVGGANADLIALWTFETSQPSSANTATIGGIMAESGSGTASGVHASALTDWSNPAGNASAESFSSTNWAIGDYYQFSVSTLGFFDINVSWDQTRSPEGPNTFDLEYSVNGGSFVTAINDYDVAQITWSSGGIRNAMSFESADLSSVSAVDGAASLIFRLIAASAPGDDGGTNRVDNFLVEGTAVPEPSAVLFGGLVSLMVGLAVVVRRLAWMPVPAKVAR
jgi:hypothetical protein